MTRFTPHQNTPRRYRIVAGWCLYLLRSWCRQSKPSPKRSDTSREEVRRRFRFLPRRRCRNRSVFAFWIDSTRSTDTNPEFYQVSDHTSLTSCSISFLALPSNALGPRPPPLHIPAHPAHQQQALLPHPLGNLVSSPPDPRELSPFYPRFAVKLNFPNRRKVAAKAKVAEKN